MTEIAAKAGEEEEKTWEEALRGMLPEGAPLPDEEQLDFSIAVEYEGPPLPHNNIPKVDPVNLNSLSLPKITRRKLPRFNRASFTDLKVKFSNGRNGDDDDDDGLQSRDFSNDDVSINDLSSPVNGDDGGGVEDVKEELGVDESKKSKVVWKKKRRGGVCNRCLKWSHFLKEREACLVCDARYCSNCLIKAMGSMPEGRKCVNCIGKAIDESKRSMLGKPSRILSKVCSTLEVKQIMKAEKECASNQLRPEQLIVNGRQLNQDELAELLGCPNPPQKLKPGKYWYDKDSGLWGEVNSSILHFLYK